MNIDAEIRVAMLDIEAAINYQLARGNREIERTIADARAWIRHWPNPVPNRRSAGQFWRHAKARHDEKPLSDH